MSNAIIIWDTNHCLVLSYDILLSQTAKSWHCWALEQRPGMQRHETTLLAGTGNSVNATCIMSSTPPVFLILPWVQLKKPGLDDPWHNRQTIT